MDRPDVYENCPVYEGKAVTLRLIELEDADDLLKCYSDEKAIPLFNADNCIDDFHYTTLERMREEIVFWIGCYQRKEFVRWTVAHNATDEKIGTVEMFHRGMLPDGRTYGILRIDLRSDYEKREIVEKILAIANSRFYEDFGVECILTKAVPQAAERIIALRAMGYEPIAFERADYYARGGHR